MDAHATGKGKRYSKQTSFPRKVKVSVLIALFPTEAGSPRDPTTGLQPGVTTAARPHMPPHASLHVAVTRANLHVGVTKDYRWQG
jgi:hypothetical protein